MKKFLKKIWNFIVSIPNDKLLHFDAGAGIDLYVFAILSCFLSFLPSFIIANVTSVVALLLKEVYDRKHPDGHSVEGADILWGCVGILLVDIALLLILLV